MPCASDYSPPYLANVTSAGANGPITELLMGSGSCGLVDTIDGSFISFAEANQPYQITTTAFLNATGNAIVSQVEMSVPNEQVQIIFDPPYVLSSIGTWTMTIDSSSLNVTVTEALSGITASALLPPDVTTGRRRVLEENWHTESPSRHAIFGSRDMGSHHGRSLLTGYTVGCDVEYEICTGFGELIQNPLACKVLTFVMEKNCGFINGRLGKLGGITGFVFRKIPVDKRISQIAKDFDIPIPTSPFGVAVDLGFPDFCSQSVQWGKQLCALAQTPGGSAILKSGRICSNERQGCGRPSPINVHMFTNSILAVNTNPEE